MAVKAGPPGPVFWVFAGILCACTLGALLVTAAQIKARKMAARYGERIEAEPLTDGRIPEILLRRGQSTRVEHLRLEYPQEGDALLVRDAQDRALVRFTGLRTGQERGWQELRLKLLEVRKDEVRLAAEFRPGSACFGAGTYLNLRPGLRVEFPAGRSATLISWDAGRPQARLKVEAEGHAEEESIGPDDPRTILGLRISLSKADLTLSD